MEISSRIKILRENHGMTQIELAKVLNIGNSTLSQYESGARVPSDDIKIIIANYFDVSLDYLLGRDEKEKPTPEDGGGLSETEQQIMECVGQMSEREKEAFLAYLRASQGRD